MFSTANRHRRVCGEAVMAPKKNISNVAGFAGWFWFCFSGVLGKESFSRLSESVSHTQMLCLVSAQS